MLFKHALKTESLELVSRTFVEFVLEFNPMQSNTMQAALKAVHQHDDSEGGSDEDVIGKEHGEVVAACEAGAYGVIEEYFGQLTVCK